MIRPKNVFLSMFILFVSMCSCSQDNAQSSQNRVPFLGSNGITVEQQPIEKAFSGAGTSFSLVRPDGTETDVIFGYSSPKEEAVIKVNGSIFKVHQISHQILKMEQKGKTIGRHEIEIWANPQIEIKLDYRTIAAGEDGLGYSGWLTVRLNGKQATFKISGGFGC